MMNSIEYSITSKIVLDPKKCPRSACLVKEEGDAVARGGLEPQRDKTASFDDRLREGVEADDHIHSDCVPATQ